MATLQIRVDDAMKSEADDLFSSLGLDTPTAIRIFLKSAIENGGLPFSVRHRSIQDSRTGQNLYGPYSSAEEAVGSMTC